MTSDSEKEFFSKGLRRVILGSPTRQASNGRICIPIRMPLTEGSFSDMPDWVSTAFDAVAKSFTHVDPEIEQIADIMLAFHNDMPKNGGSIFVPPDAKVPNSELKKFVVLRAGEPEDPEIELQFKAYTPFSREFWIWIGEFTGKEVYMAFPNSLGEVAKPVAQSGTLPLGVNGADSEDGEASNPLSTQLGRSQAVVAVPPAAKSGPKQLAEFHAAQGDDGPKSHIEPPATTRRKPGQRVN